jgi:hypothetical protein
MLHPDETASPVKLKKAFKNSGLKSGIMSGFAQLQKLDHTELH